MTADFGADMITQLERMMRTITTVDRWGVEIRVSHFCPRGQVLLLDPAASSDCPNPNAADRVLVVPTEALAEQARKAAEQAGMVLIGD